MFIQHEREILDRSFASVKFEFTDLDGLTWSQAAKRQNSDTYLVHFPMSPHSDVALTPSFQSHNPDPLTGWVVPSCRSHDAIRIRSCSNLYKPHLIGSADQIDPKDRGSRLAGIELASGAALDSETSTSRQQAQPEMSKTPPSYSPRQKLKRTEASRCFTSSDTDTPAPLRPETYCPDPLLSSIPRVAANENSRLKLSGDHGPVPPVSTGDGISSA